MAELKDTYVVHAAMTRCTMGMRESCVVLRNTHGVFLRQQAQMTIEDSLAEENVLCFGGCYSMENPETKKKAEEIEKAVDEACPDTFLDKILGIFCKKKELETQQAQEGVPRVVGECIPKFPAKAKWDYGKDGVETNQRQPLMGGAKLRCIYGGEIEIVTSGQMESE